MDKAMSMERSTPASCTAELLAPGAAGPVGPADAGIDAAGPARGQAGALHAASPTRTRVTVKPAHARSTRRAVVLRDVALEARAKAWRAACWNQLRLRAGSSSPGWPIGLAVAPASRRGLGKAPPSSTPPVHP